MKQSINVRHDFIDVPALRKEYPHLAPLNSESYNYADVELVLGHDAFAAIHPLEYFETDSKNSPIAVRLPLGWVVSGPFPSTTCMISTCFRANVETGNLTEQVRAWYDLESFGAFKQVNPRLSSDEI